VFGRDDVTLSEDDRLTTKVSVAVAWRDSDGDLLLIGDLEQDRAAGFLRVPILHAGDVQIGLFNRAAEQVSNANLQALLRALGEHGNLDPADCAEYLAVVAPGTAQDVERAREALWLLGLVPDLSGDRIDGRRLQDNGALVRKVRAIDRATLRRLISQLAPEDKSYRALRQFSLDGDRTHLKDLSFDKVQDYVRQAAGSSGKGGTKGDQPPPITKLLKDRDLSESEFLDVVDDWTPQSSDLALDGSSVAWDAVDIELWQGVLTDDSGDNEDDDGEPAEYAERALKVAESYAVVAGGVRRPSDATPEGDRDWTSLHTMIDQLRDVEAEAESSADPLPSHVLEGLVAQREKLAPYVASIPLEGIRLFAGAPDLCAEADSYLDNWLQLYKALEALQSAIPAEYRSSVTEVANLLSLVDLDIVLDGASVIARVLPLHPVVLEPRIQAARAFAADEEAWEFLYETVKDALDPGSPTLSVVVDQQPAQLGFVGLADGLPVYSDQEPVGSPRPAQRVVLDGIDRFLGVHPYAQLGLSVALVDPDPSLAVGLVQALAKRPPESLEYVRIDVLVERSAGAELRRRLDSAFDALESSDIDVRRIRHSVVTYETDDRLSAITNLAEWPHLLVLFDESDQTDVTIGSAGAMTLRGSVVSEWTFTTDPIRKVPVIKPAAQGRLSALAYEQSQVGSAVLAETKRLPLLTAERAGALAELAAHATWLLLVESTAALSAPEELGEALLLGRVSAGDHTGFVYSATPGLLVQPVVRYIEEHAWIDPGHEALQEFLIGTVRRALPEGLLTFFGRRGPLGSEHVLGKLGVAAVLADVQTEDAEQLVMSFDTEAARRWLNKRDGNRRADLLRVRRQGDAWHVTAIEVKARTGEVSPDDDYVVDACGQASEMRELLSQLFGDVGTSDGLTKGRREILKRQIFLEAFQQWDELRTDDWTAYRARVRALGTLFEPGTEVHVEAQVYVVSVDTTEPDETVEKGDPPVPVRVLGREWMRTALGYGTAEVEVPADFFDMAAPEPPLPDDEGASDGPPIVLSEAMPGHVDPTEEKSGTDDQNVSSVGDIQSGVTADEDDWTADKEALGARVARALRERAAPFRRLDAKDIVVGPSVVQVPFEVLPGKKLNPLQAQSQDLARDLGVPSVRIDNYRDRPMHAVLELPRTHREIPDVTGLQRRSDDPVVELALGVDFEFETYWVSLADLPHLLIAGTTGSGKSVFVRSLLWQLTHLYGAEEVEIVLIDAKGMRDYSDFRKAPQFRRPSDFHLGVTGALEKFSSVVEAVLPERIRTFNAYADEAEGRESPVHLTDLPALLRDAAAHGHEPPLVPLVVIIDEFNELMLGASDRREFERLITSFVQKARAVGGHLIAATQRPSVDVVTGVMKSNFARLSLRVQSAVDSRVILDDVGAEALLPWGDLLFRSSSGELVRLQGFSALGLYLPGGQSRL
jgi:hypothetical protein